MSLTTTSASDTGAGNRNDSLRQEPMRQGTPTATDPNRERVRQWRAVGESVRQAMPMLASQVRPSRDDFKSAAGKLGMTVADTQRAWGFVLGDIEAPKKKAPTLKARVLR